MRGIVKAFAEAGNPSCRERWRLIQVNTKVLVSLPVPHELLVILSRGDDARLMISDVNTLPPVQPRVSRPGAWPEQCQRGTECREQDERPGI